VTATGGWVVGSETGIEAARSAGSDMLTEDPQERIAYPVRSASWVQSFFEISAEAASRLEVAAIKRTFRRGETILRREDRGDRLFMITRGQVKMLLGGKGRDDLLIAVLGEADYFGEWPMIDGRPWPISVIAIEPTETYVLNRDVVLKALAESAELATEFLFNMADHLRDTYEMIQDSIFLDVAGRLAKKLLDLARDYGRSTPEGIVIDIGLTQQDLARMVGVTRESVNKHLGTFRSRGIVETRDRRIIICRPDELKRRIY
jgi:CRP/FNR family transcriptional regulator, cyclic AMP receptor protein